jgi:RsiW-degrading membrane proteinase PrsW (M82 family)
MLELAVNFFLSGFVYPGVLWHQVLISIGLALAFGAVWFAAYWTPVLWKPWAWAVLAGSAFLTWTAVAFIQIPLQQVAGNFLFEQLGTETYQNLVLLVGIPGILLTGLVQEGSKLVPVVVCWWRRGRKLYPRFGLVIGAVAGLGLGLLEAVWAHNSVFISGWGWGTVQSSGLIALAPFWERFFTIAAHIAFSAIAGWGLAKGWGWQFYLIAAVLHAFLNYSVVLLYAGYFTATALEIQLAVIAAVVTAAALWLRWGEPSGPAVSETTPAQTSDTEPV